MKIIFIAGPLTSGWDWKDREFLEKRIKEAEKFQIKLINSKIGCFCAHTHTSFHHEKGSEASEEFYKKMDFEFLKRMADAVLAMPKWEESSGAKEEIKFAKEKGLPIFYPKSSEDIQEIIDWAKEEI